MRRDYVIAIILALAALPSGAALMVAPEYLHLTGWAVPATFWGGIGLTVLLLIAAGLVARHGAEQGETPRQSPDAETRRALINGGRALAVDSLSMWRNPSDFADMLEASAIYFQLRPHLSDEFNKAVRNRRVLIVPPEGSKMSGLAHRFLAELDRLERDWGVQV